MTIFITSVLLLCYVIGIWLLVEGLKQIRLGLAARSWPTTDASLNKCVVEARYASNTRVYQVSVKYAYAVAGVAYTGDTLAIGYGASSGREAHEMARRRVLDMDRFVIRYHPEQPEMSAIFPSENSLIAGTFVFSLLWLSFTICFTLLALATSGVGSALLGWFGWFG